MKKPLAGLGRISSDVSVSDATIHPGETHVNRLILTLATLATTASLPALAQTTPAPTAPVAGSPTASTVTPPAQPAAGAVPANPPVGGVAMEPTRTIAANAAAAPTLSTLVAAIKAAGLDTTLAGPGPFTVFAPTNEAFGRLAPGTVDTLLKPENKATLIRVLRYHVVPGTITLEQLKAQITAGGGRASLTTVEGSPLTATMEGNALALTDANGSKAYLEIANVRQSNGIVHVINGVVSPKLG